MSKTLQAMYVIKRNGQKEPVQFDKITRRIFKLCDTLENVDPVRVTQKLCNRVFPGITTSELDNLSSQICMSMVTESPEYAALAGRIAVSNHQKNTSEDVLEVFEELYNNRDLSGDPAPLVNKELLELVRKNRAEYNMLLVHGRDYFIDYFGFKTLERSYLLKTVTKIVERPQHLFLRVAIGIHGEDFANVAKTYNNLSQKNYTHATPTLFNAGTQKQQLASCFLGAIDDSLEGIFEAYKQCGLLSKWAGGIGIHISNIRSRGAYIRGTGGRSDGIVPLLRTFGCIARQFNQGGKRLGSFSMYLEPWHPDVEAFLEAKRNQGVETERARDLFYALWVPDLFMRKAEADEDWYLLDPDRCRGLTDVYGEEFDKLYNSYVEKGMYKKAIKARKLLTEVIKTQVETGGPYICYKDAVNKKSNQANIGTIKSSNLCSEITLYSSLEETAVCTLASIVLPSCVTEPDLRAYTDGDLYLYSRPGCSYCKLLKAALTRLGLSWTDLSGSEAREMAKECKMEFPNTVPQLYKVVCIISQYVDEKTEYPVYMGGYEECWKSLRPVFDFGKLRELTCDLVVNLNKVVDNNFYPNEQTRLSNTRHRPLGIGVQGLADVFATLRLPFTSREARELNKHIFETIYHAAVTGSADQAEIHGPYETFAGSPISKGKFQFDLWGLSADELVYDWEPLRERVQKTGVRNSCLVALMPTASTSQIMGSTECFEPVSSNVYTRRTLAGSFTVCNKYLTQDLIDLEIWNDDTRNRLIYDKGSVKNIKDLPDFLKDVYKTVWEISQRELIEMSAERGPFICQSQSLNLYFDKPDFRVLMSAHFIGWKLGLKTGSYYIRSKPAGDAQRFGMSIETEQKLESEAKSVSEVCESCSA